MISYTLIQNTFILRSPRVTIFADIIKFLPSLLKNSIKTQKEVERIKNYVSKCNLYLNYLMQQNLVIFNEKMKISVELKRCVPWFIYFLDLLLVMYNCAKFHRCRICVADFRKGVLFASTLKQPQKAPS